MPVVANASAEESDPRRLCGSALADAMRESRLRTIAWTDDLSDAQWAVPQQPGLNPIAWELAHLAWFAEFWVLRGPHRVDAAGSTRATTAAVHAGPDELLDSSVIPHARRWSVPLPSRARVGEILDSQLQACIAAVPPDQGDPALYFLRLALFHEDMHAEAFAWLRAALGYPPPAGVTLTRLPPPAALAVPGGEVLLGGARPPAGFEFDNELPGQLVTLPDFEIDNTPVSAGMYLDFVESGGYDRPEYWPDDAGRWRAGAGRSQPERWRRVPSGTSRRAASPAGGDVPWEVRWFDRWQALDPAQPVIHVNAFEAQAYCRWRGRRLPTAAQWEHAARSSRACDPYNDSRRFAWGGSVWEWTANAFEPYPGFVAGPYKEYSAPWFGSHRELRGGSFATHRRLHDPGYRNFFMPHRADIFAGFRTVSSPD